MKLMRLGKPTASVVGLAALLGGCSGLLHSDRAPEQVYYLRAQPNEARSVPAGAAAGGSSVRVAHPFADPGLDSTHLVLLRPDRRMDFYAGSRWPAPATQLIEALAVDRLRGSGAWRSVADSMSPFPSEYLLQISIRQFAAEYGAATDAPEVHVVLDCTLGIRDGRVAQASFRAEGRSRAAANRMSSVVQAFEEATNEALTTLAAEALRFARQEADPAR